MTGRHRGGRSLRRRLIVAVLASALGRGYEGRHRLLEAALGRPATVIPVADAGRPAEVADLVLVPEPADDRSGTAVDGASRQSVAPWLTVVRTSHEVDLLADTLPHPVVTLFPLTPEVSGGEGRSPAEHDGSGDQAEDEVFAALDSEREVALTADLAVGGVVALYRPRHTA